MSKDEELLEEVEHLLAVFDAADDFCEFTVAKMNADEIQIACDNKEVGIEFLEKLKALIQALTGADVGYEYTDNPDSTSGSPEADSREESGELRPSNRKLH